MDPTISHDPPGDAPDTDIRLIGGDPTLFSAFAPTSDFSIMPIPAGQAIVSATLTMRTGAWVSGPDPISGPNCLMLNGKLVPAQFLGQFNANTTTELTGGNQIETHSIMLDPSFFPVLASGVVSLAGTQISEDVGAGSFQVDFLRLDIQAVPEPTSLVLLALGGLTFVAVRTRRFKEAKGPPSVV
ncbi:MAG: PEP-CTERM sorting domain-containing protein [Isosphaeraceae bacterium]